MEGKLDPGESMAPQGAARRPPAAMRRARFKLLSAIGGFYIRFPKFSMLSLVVLAGLVYVLVSGLVDTLPGEGAMMASPPVLVRSGTGMPTSNRAESSGEMSPVLKAYYASPKDEQRAIRAVESYRRSFPDIKPDDLTDATATRCLLPPECAKVSEKQEGRFREIRAATVARFQPSDRHSPNFYSAFTEALARDRFIPISYIRRVIGNYPRQLAGEAKLQEFQVELFKLVDELAVPHDKRPRERAQMLRAYLDEYIKLSQSSFKPIYETGCPGVGRSFGFDPDERAACIAAGVVLRQIGQRDPKVQWNVLGEKIKQALRDRLGDRQSTQDALSLTLNSTF